MSAVRLTQSSQSSGMHEERAAAAAAVAVMSSGEYKSIPIRDSNRFESIRFVKKSAVRFTSCYAVFLAYGLFIV